MSTIPPRNFNCKVEELPVICGFVAQSLRRDLADFANYSPLFTEDYLTVYESKIATIKELVEPQSETIEMKLITERMYNMLDDLISPINYICGYLDLAGKSVPISATDFGLNDLRKSCKRRDVENVLKQLRIVTGNLDKYKSELSSKGLTDAMILKFASAKTSLDSDKQKKYELISNRAAIVQNNLGMLNELNDLTNIIRNIGKILYKQTNPAKLNDYTFAFLLKQVRRVEKTKEEAKPEEQAAETPMQEK